MASINGSGSSKHRTSDDQDNSSHYSHSSSSSSSSSYASSVSLSSKSNSLKSDVDEKDQLSPTKSENENLKSSPAEWSMLSVSPRAGYSPSEMSQNSVSSTLPPPVQTMGRFPGYDPSRIPSSVFGNSKPAGNMEWSVASNESLFSIQMGNNSFTRDQFNLLKSGELKSPDEFMKSMSGLPPITETSTNETSTNELHGLPVVNEAASENVTGRESIECEEVKEIKNNETVMTADKIRLSVSTSNVSENQGMPHTPARASDGSRMSNGSFAFPVLGGETPSRSSVKKPIIQQQQQQQQQEQKQQEEAPEEPQKQAETNKWVACFSCCPFCK